VDEPRTPFLGVPPERKPRPVTEVPAVRGKRVILSRPDGFLYDQRAVSEVYAADDGRAHVRVCSEVHWYRWMLTGEKPHIQAYPAYLVWVE
jgi:hypothetical protein